MEKDNDPETGSVAGGGPQSVPHWRLVADQALVTQEVKNWNYEGSGTEDDPYVSTILYKDTHSEANIR